MQYHVLSLVNEMGVEVDFVGYGGSAPLSAIQRSDKVRIHLLKAFRSPVPIPYLLYAVCKVALESIQLVWIMLIRAPRPLFILAQNPPSIPVLAWCVVICLLRRASFLIDFHNFGYTMLAMKLGQGHPLVKISYVYEWVVSRCAVGGFAVTKAMQIWLKENWQVSSVVLYDRPADRFKETDLASQRDLFLRLEKDGALQRLEGWTSGSISNIFVDQNLSKPQSRPQIMVSSTSWSPDENFDLLVEALPGIEEHLQRGSKRLVIFITGKGPLRAAFENKVSQLSLKQVAIVCVWLAVDDYPRLLGCCDFGLSFHTSSSGLDLPMKVVDMFGAGLPVCSASFLALPELVRHGENGMVFDDAKSLLDCITHCLTALDPAQERKWRAAVRLFREFGWTQQWRNVALPELNRVS
mmetsp:Transcript_46631/g.99947  ORF Transcript_46631/g.99947 Transcript_46631/m.99947 type:complete len:409 (+) Transcript_46631:131-1357(+)